MCFALSGVALHGGQRSDCVSCSLVVMDGARSLGWLDANACTNCLL